MTNDNGNAATDLVLVLVDIVNRRNSIDPPDDDLDSDFENALDDFAVEIGADYDLINSIRVLRSLLR